MDTEKARNFLFWGNNLKVTHQFVQSPKKKIFLGEVIKIEKQSSHEIAKTMVAIAWFMFFMTICMTIMVVQLIVEAIIDDAYSEFLVNRIVIGGIMLMLSLAFTIWPFLTGRARKKLSTKNGGDLILTTRDMKVHVFDRVENADKAYDAIYHQIKEQVDEHKRILREKEEEREAILSAKIRAQEERDAMLLEQKYQREQKYQGVRTATKVVSGVAGAVFSVAGAILGSAFDSTEDSSKSEFKFDPCPRCKGSGTEWSSERIGGVNVRANLTESCRRCGGSGKR